MPKVQLIFIQLQPQQRAKDETFFASHHDLTWTQMVLKLASWTTTAAAAIAGCVVSLTISLVCTITLLIVVPCIDTNSSTAWNASAWQQQRPTVAPVTFARHADSNDVSAALHGDQAALLRIGHQCALPEWARLVVMSSGGQTGGSRFLVAVYAGRGVDIVSEALVAHGAWDGDLLPTLHKALARRPASALPADAQSSTTEWHRQQGEWTQRELGEAQRPLLVDVGANVGYFTLYAAAVLGADAIAVEPLRENVELLTVGACANGRSVQERVTLYNVAATPLRNRTGSDGTSSDDGDEVVCVVYSHAGNFGDGRLSCDPAMVAKHAPGGRGPQERIVKAARLDALLLPHLTPTRRWLRQQGSWHHLWRRIDLLKLDVEGHETGAMESGSRAWQPPLRPPRYTIAECHAAQAAEAGPGAKAPLWWHAWLQTQSGCTLEANLGALWPPSQWLASQRWVQGALFATCSGANLLMACPTPPASAHYEGGDSTGAPFRCKAGSVWSNVPSVVHLSLVASVEGFAWWPLLWSLGCAGLWRWVAQCRCSRASGKVRSSKEALGSELGDHAPHATRSTSSQAALSRRRVHGV